mmetsp:Transcript_23633/g.54939  ORF Transcript_23633/g.54939 Transcript_23633/m.54939 type:complete len:243 (-) Transcript_23633:182-910(-)
MPATWRGLTKQNHSATHSLPPPPLQTPTEAEALLIERNRLAGVDEAAGWTGEGLLVCPPVVGDQGELPHLQSQPLVRSLDVPVEGNLPVLPALDRRVLVPLGRSCLDAVERRTQGGKLGVHLALLGRGALLRKRRDPHLHGVEKLVLNLRQLGVEAEGGLGRLLLGRRDLHEDVVDSLPILALNRFPELQDVEVPPNLNPRHVPKVRPLHAGERHVRVRGLHGQAGSASRQEGKGRPAARGR